VDTVGKNMSTVRTGLLLSLFVVVLGLVCAAAQTRYFPERTFDNDARTDQSVAEWYSTMLKALHEPSLLESSKDPSLTEFRFLWLRTFHHPVAIRVVVKPDGTGTLITKITSGAGGYEPGKLTTNRTRKLSRDETQLILQRFQNSNFWALPTHERKVIGVDGAEWVFEAALKGKYHLVSDWSPKKGTVYDLGTFFLFDLEKLEISHEEFY